MAGRGLVLSMLVALILCPVVALGQSPELLEAYKRFEELHARGDTPGAILFAEQAAALAEEEFGLDHPHLAAMLNNVAVLYKSLGQYGRAEPPQKQALAIAEEIFGPEHPNVATGLHNLAELYREQGKYAEAEPLYRRALAIREAELGPDHGEVAVSLESYAALLDASGRSAEATEMTRRAEAIRAKQAEETR